MSKPSDDQTAYAFQQATLKGHEPRGTRININKELKRLKKNPLEPFLQLLESQSPASILSTEPSRFRDAYLFYYLSVGRCLHAASLASRWQRTSYWARRSGYKYTKVEAQTAKEYNKIEPYLEYDIVNCVLHARILLDRLAALSRSFLTSGARPSFSSFNKHKEFFEARTGQVYGQHERYAEYIRSNTAWFNDPLKDVRDRFIVHAAPKHMRCLTWPNPYELCLLVFEAKGTSAKAPLAEHDVIRISVAQLILDVEQLLTWFCEYGLDALSQREQPR